MIEMSYDFSQIERDMYFPGRERPENDAEHTFQLVLACWHIINADKLPLNKEKVFKIAIAHDLVELYAGDVPLWGKDGHNTKDAKEKTALQIIKKVLPTDTDMTDAIAEYKESRSDEALFVRGVDKLLPFMNQLHIEGRVWKDHNLGIETVLKKLDEQMKISPYLEKYFQEGITHMKENEKKYFNKEIV